MHVNDASVNSSSDEQKPAAVQKDRPRECHEVVDTYFQIVKKLAVEVRQSVLQPLYKEQRLLQFYLNKTKRLTLVGDTTYMSVKDKNRINNYEKNLRAIDKHRNLEAGHKELRKNRDLANAHRYHDLICVKVDVVVHVRACYHIQYTEAQRIEAKAKEEGLPFYIL